MTIQDVQKIIFENIVLIIEQKNRRNYGDSSLILGFSQTIEREARHFSDGQFTIDCLEMLNKMITAKETEVVIEGYSDNKIHAYDARVELWVLYKARDLFTKEKSK